MIHAVVKRVITIASIESIITAAPRDRIISCVAIQDVLAFTP
jgi:hypothetical protein